MSLLSATGPRHGLALLLHERMHRGDLPLGRGDPRELAPVLSFHVVDVLGDEMSDPRHIFASGCRRRGVRVAADRNIGLHVHLVRRLAVQCALQIRDARDRTDVGDDVLGSGLHRFGGLFGDDFAEAPPQRSQVGLDLLQACVELDLSGPGLVCNCSMCGRSGSMLMFTKPEKFTLVSGEDNLTDYVFHKHVIHHVFCKTCGIKPFARGTTPKGDMVAINIRTLADVDPFTQPTKQVDGKSF